MNANVRGCNAAGGGSNLTCGPNPNGTAQITSTISNGVVNITYSFTDTANFTNVFNDFVTNLNQQRTNNPNYLNPLDANYFRYIELRYPVGNGCGDLSTYGQIYLPLWLTYTNTSNSLTVSFTQITPTQRQNLIDAYTLTSCDSSCFSSLDTSISRINNTAINLFTTPLNITNSTGGYYSNSFIWSGGLGIGIPNLVTSAFSSNNPIINAYQNCTYMFSGNPLTLINTVPYKVCDFVSIGGWKDPGTTYNVTNSLPTYIREFYFYKVSPRFPYNPSFPGDFLIEGRVPVNGVLSSTLQFAYQRLNGVVTTSSTFII
jgi:hypothetical protein